MAADEIGRPSASAVFSIDRTRMSPNHGVRAGGFAKPDCIVLHYTGMRDGPSAVDWLCAPESGVSCHYVVHETGLIQQLVPEERRAWHAGVSCWEGVTDINSASVGIEIVNGGHDFGLPDFPSEQIDAVLALCCDIVDRLVIWPDRILAHSDIAPSRKRDPGERFPWARLADAGLGLWVEPETSLATHGTGTGQDIAIVQTRLQALGFCLHPSGVADTETEIVVRAFQRHFRPTSVDGVADEGTCAVLERLLSHKRSILQSRSSQA